MFKLLNKITAWFFKNLIIANQKILNESSAITSNSTTNFRNTISILASDLRIPDVHRKVLSEYLWRTRRDMIKAEEK